MQILVQGAAGARRLSRAVFLFRASLFFFLFFFSFSFFTSPPALAVSAECAALGARLADIDKGFLFINAISRTEAEALINACGKDANAAPDDMLPRFYMGLGFVRLDRWQDAEGHLKRASERYPLALVPYAAMLYHGFGVSKDLKKAEDLLRRPETTNLPAAQLTLGNMLAQKSGKENAQAALTLWQAAAAKGYAEAERALGFAFFDGTPAVPADPARAAAYFRGAAEKGDLESTVQYVFMLEEREGRSADYYKWLHAAALGGDEWAMSQWAASLAAGEGVGKDEKAAFVLMSKAAEGSEGYGLRGLADFYRDGIGTPKNPQKAFALYKACAERGDKSARYIMAYMLASGEGVERNEKQGYQIMLQSAEDGDKNAQRWLGWYLFRLDQENMSEAAWNQAVYWSGKAAEGGEPDVRYAAAYILLSPWASREQEQKALADLTKLANENYAPAMLRLSQVYAEGMKSVPRDRAQARQWAEKAMAADAAGARSRLAGLLFYEFGGEEDLRQAASLWREAAERERDPVAAFMLGQSYHNGVGVPKDSVQAMAWLRKSIAGGYEPARQLLASILFYGAPGVPADARGALALCKETIADYATLPVGIPRLKLVDALMQAGFFHTALGEYDMAETYLKRAVEEAEDLAALGAPVLARSSAQLAELYVRWGKPEQARKVFQATLPVLEREIAEAPENAMLLFDYGLFQEKTNDRDGARKTFERIRGLLKKSGQAQSTDLFDVEARLGRVEYKADNPKKAAELLRGALEGYAKTGRPPATKSIQVLSDLALAEAVLGESEAAARDFFAAENLAVAAGLDMHPYFLAYAEDMAGKFIGLKKWEEARALLSRVSAQYPLRLDLQARAGVSPEERNATRLTVRLDWLRYLDTLTNAAAGLPKNDSARVDALNAEFFSVIQSVAAQDGANAIPYMASRHIAGRKPLDDLLARRGALLENLERVNKDLRSGFRREGGESGPEPRALVDLARSLTNDLAALDKTVGRDFPAFSHFTSGAPLPLAEARTLLKPGEALLLFAFGPKDGYVFALTHDKAAALSLPGISEVKINADVAKLRAGLEPASPAMNARPPLLDGELAYSLYSCLFGPLEETLGAVKHLFIVPAGPLSGLPFSALLSEKPENPLKEASEYKALPWLARAWSVSLLPSVNSLRGLRELARPSQAGQPFLGIGDPKLGAPEKEAAPRIAGNSPVTRGAAGQASPRDLPSLPDTADELREMATALSDKAPDSLLLAGEATEKNLRARNLGVYKVIAFATHGLIAGNLGGLPEPALVLSPPAFKPGETMQADNDGLLLSSEAAVLSLDADWLILMACVTAAGDGKAGAEGLSALSRAFFLAGARALLVSHWPAYPHVSTELVSRMLKHLVANPAMYRAEALRLAMLELMDSADEPGCFPEPGVWASYMMVGDGGPLPQAERGGAQGSASGRKP